ncbi:MAG: hypothetical protein Q4F71_04690 [Paracoccus sp. (in: a-proteobacteria)]|nr:hypothetical protein [Paracoccus sp. (in: a-proteobacteria)]
MIRISGHAFCPVGRRRRGSRWLLACSTSGASGKSSLAQPGRSKAGISGLLDYAVGPEAAAWFGAPEVIAFLLVTTLGYLALDFTTALSRDRDLLFSIVARRLGRHDE